MKFDLEYEFECLFEKWLLNNYPDEIKGKDDLIDKVTDRYKYEEFLKDLEAIQ